MITGEWARYVQDVSWHRHSKHTLSPWEEKFMSYLLYNGILHQAEAAGASLVNRVREKPPYDRESKREF